MGILPLFTGNYFAERGYFVLSFNFSHNGIGENLTEFTELDKFADNTFSLELEELNEVIDAYLNNFFGNRSNKNDWNSWAQSEVVGNRLLFLQEEKKLLQLLLWASVANFNRYTETTSKRVAKKWCV